MKTNSIKHEILLFTTTTFSKRQLCEMNAQDDNNNLCPSQQLEIACWNGLLDELLPEVMFIPFCRERLFMWDVETRKSYLRINRGVSEPVPENEFSVDPHIFLTMLQMN